MDERRLIEHSIRESPASESHFGWEVAFPVIAATLATYALVWALLGHKNGAAAAGVVALIVLFYRLYQWDAYAHGTHIIEHKIYKEDDTEPRRELTPVMVRNGDAGNSHVWTIGRWKFSNAEWKRLWDQVLSKGTVTRDSLADVMLDNGTRMFPNYTGRWREYQTEFRRLRWVDQDNIVTDDCRAWFAERNLIPLPADEGAENVQR